MKFGINNYPSFSDVPKADAWAKKYHGRVSDDGKLNNMGNWEFIEVGRNVHVLKLT